MHMLVWAFAGRTYHIFGNLMLRLILLLASTWDFGTYLLYCQGNDGSGKSAQMRRLFRAFAAYKHQEWM